MKNTITTLFFAIITYSLAAQETQQISIGAGYNQQSYINLAAGTEQQAANSAWDIAFSVQDAGIFVNESSGSVSGQPQPTVHLFYTFHDDFADVISPAEFENNEIFNAEKSWQYGAFNEIRDQNDPLDLGWGRRDEVTNQIGGIWVYTLELRNGEYRKLKVESLDGGVYTFQYAQLDGSQSVTKTINTADFSGQTLVYYSFDTETIVEVEPAGGFDLLYCRYVTPIYEPVAMEYIPYNVTGVLTGKGVEVAQAAGVDVATVSFADYSDSLSADMGIIGHDWKAFASSGWQIDANLAFFVKTAENRIWKLHFNSFSGSGTGNAVFEKTDLGVVAAYEQKNSMKWDVLTYPNPATDFLYIALDQPAAQSAVLEVVNMEGRVIRNIAVQLRGGFQVLEVPAAEWAKGIYQLGMNTGGQTISLGKVVVK